MLDCANLSDNIDRIIGLCYNIKIGFAVYCFERYTMPK